MDPTDLHIVRRLGVVPFLEGVRPLARTAHARIAKDLGIAVETVRRRLTALRDEGVVSPTLWWPNPRHFGRWMTSFHVTGPDPVGLPGVTCCISMLGGTRCVDLVHRDEADLQDALRRLETHGCRTEALLEYPLPQPTRRLTPLDLKIVSALRWMDHTDVAEALGIHPRTVKRRVDAMIAGGDLDHVVSFDPSALDGELLGYVFVHHVPGADSTDRARTQRAIAGHWVAQWSMPGGPGRLAAVVVATPGGLEALRQELQSLPSVARAEAAIVHAAWSDNHWLDSALSETWHALPDGIKPLASR